MIKTAFQRIYGAYAAAAFVVIVLLVFCPVLILAPTLNIRRAIGRAAVRAWLLVIFVRFRVTGLEHLPDGPCVALSNHASYVDGILFTAALPSRFTFLVKHSAADWPYVGLIIRRMGVKFVDRWSPSAAARALRVLIRDAEKGRSLAIFPEGTFEQAPGLMPFYGGAFLIAAKTGVPVVPAVMSGTRQFFGEGQRMPHWTAIDVELFAPIAPEKGDRLVAEALCDAARAVMLSQCGEGEGPQPKLRPQSRFLLRDRDSRVCSRLTDVKPKEIEFLTGS